MDLVFQAVDPYLIWLYRITGHPYLGFLLGTFALACLALILGEGSISLIIIAMRKHLDRSAGEAARYQELSVQALKAGDKEAYQAANKLANEAFGKSFFLQFSLAAARLWPLPFALAWMQLRFLEVEFPLLLLPFSLGYIGVFILCYAAAYFLWKTVKGRFRHFRSGPGLSSAKSA